MGVGLWFIAPQSSLPKGPSGPLLMVFDTQKGPTVQERKGHRDPLGLLLQVDWSRGFRKPTHCANMRQDTSCLCSSCMWGSPKTGGTLVPYFGAHIIRILLFRVP